MIINKISLDIIAIVSLHEKGFWQADVYYDGHDDAIPDWFCTGKCNDDMFGVINIVSKQFPGITFAQGITGICDDCQEEFILNESVCYCGGSISQP